MAAPIDPSTLVGLKCWLRPGVGVETVSGHVSAWRDQSGHGKDLLQGSSGARPTFVADAGDGRPAVFLDGVNDYLGPALDVITSAGKAYTAIVTSKADPGSTAGLSLTIGGGTSSGGGSWNMAFSSDPASGITNATPISDDGLDNTDLGRQFGTADFETLCFRQDYFWTPQNFLEQSVDFSETEWWRVGFTVQQGIVAAPDGSMTGAVIQALNGAIGSSLGSVAAIQQLVTIPSLAAADVYDASVWVKADRRLPAVALSADLARVALPDAASMRPGSGSFVVAFWYHAGSNLANTHGIVEYNDGADYTTGFLFNNFGGDLDVYVNSGPPQFAIFGAFLTPQWVRVVLVGDANAGTLTLYLNGVSQGVATSTTWNLTTTAGTKIGHGLFDGARGLVRDYVVCKAGTPGFVVPTLGVVQADHARTADFSGISARYPLNEGTGTSVVASVGGGGPGTLSGGAAWQASAGNLKITVGGENILLWNTDYLNAVWSNGGDGLVVHNTAVNPITGLTDAASITCQTTGVAVRDFSQTLAVAGVYTTSAVVHANAQSWCILGGQGGGVATWFDLGTGVVATQAGSTGTIQALEGGWYRVTMTFTATVSTIILLYATNGNGVAAYPGNAGEHSIDFCEFQMVAGTDPGPLTPTAGTAKTTHPAHASVTPTASWTRVDFPYTVPASPTTDLSVAFELDGAFGDEFQVWGPQLAHSGAPVAYTPTTKPAIGIAANAEVGVYTTGVNLRGNTDITDSNDAAPYTENNATGRDVAIGAAAYWDGTQLQLSVNPMRGYVRDVLLFDRALTDDEFAGVYSFLQNAPEDSAPTVSNVSPTPGTAISRSDPLFFDITDDKSSLRLALVAARFANGAYEVVHDGDGFAAGYASLSSREAIAGGFRYRVRRSAGWPSGPTIVPFVVDTSGQENP